MDGLEQRIEKWSQPSWEYAYECDQKESDEWIREIG